VKEEGKCKRKEGKRKDGIIIKKIRSLY